MVKYFINSYCSTSYMNFLSLAASITFVRSFAHCFLRVANITSFQGVCVCFSLLMNSAANSELCAVLENIGCLFSLSNE